MKGNEGRGSKSNLLFNLIYWGNPWKTPIRLMLLLLLGYTTLLTSQVISVAFDIESEKSDKFCSEALISAWGSFTYRKSTTRDQRLYFPFRRRSYSGFLRSEKIHRPRPGLNPRTSDPVASMIQSYLDHCCAREVTSMPLIQRVRIRTPVGWISRFFGVFPQL